MCWSEEVSWSTFIIGTILNIITSVYSKEPMVIATCFIWQYVLFMQFFDALSWRITDNKCSNTTVNNKTNTKFVKSGTYLFNMFQPLVVYMCLIIVSPVDIRKKIYASIICFCYLNYVLYTCSDSNKLDYEIDKSPDCHIQYSWWSERHKNGGIIYLVTIVLIILLLARPMTFSSLTVLYVIITLMISMSIYKQQGTIANMWCWFAAFAPMFTLAFWNISNMNIK